MPVARVASVTQLPAPRIALVAGAGEPVRGPMAGSLVIGAERAGLPREVVDACEAVVHIPIVGDSLNAAMAATIALYESTRVTAP
jgi:TrmH family RNA methyltransferase